MFVSSAVNCGLKSLIVSDCFLTPSEEFFSHIITRTSYIRCDDDDDVRFLLDQHTELDFYSSLVAQLRHNNLIGNATNTNFLVFGVTRSGLEHTIYRTRGKHHNHYIIDAIFKSFFLPYLGLHNAQFFVQILYFVGVVHIINRNNVFHSFPDRKITCPPCFFVYYCQHAKLNIS